MGRRNNYSGWDRRAGNPMNASRDGQAPQSGVSHTPNAFSGHVRQHQPWPSQNASSALEGNTQTQIRHKNAFAGGQIGNGNAFGWTGPPGNAFHCTGQHANVFMAAGQSRVIATGNAIKNGGQQGTFANAFSNPVTSTARQNAFSALGSISEPGWPDQGQMQPSYPVSDPSLDQHTPNLSHSTLVASSHAGWPHRPAAMQTMNVFSAKTAQTTFNPFYRSRQGLTGSMETNTTSGFSTNTFGGYQHMIVSKGMDCQLPASQCLKASDASAPADSVSDEVFSVGEQSMTPADRESWEAPSFSKGNIPEIAPPSEVCF